MCDESFSTICSWIKTKGDKLKRFIIRTMKFQGNQLSWLKSALGARKLQLEYVQVCEFNDFPNNYKKDNMVNFQFDLFEKDKVSHVWERFR